MAMTLYDLKVVLNSFAEMLSNSRIPVLIDGREIESVELRANDGFQISINTRSRNATTSSQQPDKSSFPKCPNCGSYNYEVGFLSSDHNCRCRDCGTMFFYNFCM